MYSRSDGELWSIWSQTWWDSVTTVTNQAGGQNTERQTWVNLTKFVTLFFIFFKDCSNRADMWNSILPNNLTMTL